MASLILQGVVGAGASLRCSIHPTIDISCSGDGRRSFQCARSSLQSLTECEVLFWGTCSPSEMRQKGPIVRRRKSICRGHQDPSVQVSEQEKLKPNDVQNNGKNCSEDEQDEEVAQGYKISRVCDRLIEVFMVEKPTVAEWRNLLALSKEWARIRPHFFKRCEKKAKAETDRTKRKGLVSLAKRVKKLDDSMIQHDELLADVEGNAEALDAIIAKRRENFSGEFFEYLQTLTDASPTAFRRDEVAAIAAQCLSGVEAYDAALLDKEALVDAKSKFDDILNSSSLEAAAAKIEQLAQEKELDSALILFITKTWAEAKESTTMQQEAKDIMLFLYQTTRACMQKIVPDEVRIIKRLLAIEDPRDRFAALTQSFAPGDDFETQDPNVIYTKPEKLKRWIKILLDAYHSNKQYTLIKEARELMNPEVIARLEMMMEFCDDQFTVGYGG